MITLINKQKRLTRMKLIRCAWLSMWLCLSTTTVVAAPQDSSQAREDTRSSYPQKEEYRRGTYDQDQARQQQRPAEHRRQRHIEIQVRIGAPIPKPNNYQQLEINYAQYPHLSPPSRYQQWIKVDNYFVLINVLTNTVLKVVPAE